jgi:uncharacterized protein YehS (DUF1456 family)
MEAGDLVLRNFLNGLIIYKRSKQEDNEIKEEGCSHSLL